MPSNSQPPIQIQPDTPEPQKAAFINQNFQALANSLSPLIVSDGTTNRIILGKQPDGTYGLKVSQSGVDVGSATNNQLVFNSSQDIFKIVTKIQTSTSSFATTYNGSVTSGGTLLTVPHGQSFTPIVEVYAQAGIVNLSTGSVIVSSYIPLPFFPVNLASYYVPAQSSGTSYPIAAVFAVDSANVYVEVYFNSSGDVHDTIAAIPITIFVLQETAN